MKHLLLIIIALIMGSCVSRAKSKTSSKEVSQSAGAVKTTQTTTTQTQSTALEDNTQLTYYADELQGSIHLAEGMTDSLESTGLKVIASVQELSNGQFKARFNIKAKPTAKLTQTTQTKDSQTTQTTSVSKDSISDSYAAVERKELEAKSKKFAVPWWLWVIALLVVGYGIYRYVLR